MVLVFSQFKIFFLNAMLLDEVISTLSSAKVGQSTLSPAIPILFCLPDG